MHYFKETHSETIKNLKNFFRKEKFKLYEYPQGRNLVEIMNELGAVLLVKTGYKTNDVIFSPRIPEGANINYRYFWYFPKYNAIFAWTGTVEDDLDPFLKKLVSDSLIDLDEKNQKLLTK